MAKLPTVDWIKANRRWLVWIGLGVALLIVIVGLVGDCTRQTPPPLEPDPDVGPPPLVWHGFNTTAIAVQFQVPDGFTATAQDGKPLTESEAVYFQSRDEPLAGFSFALCREAEAPKCLPKQAQLIASAKVTVDGTSRGLQLVSERTDGQGDRVLIWQTLAPIEPKMYVSFGMQYPMGYAGAPELEDLYRELLTRVEFGTESP